MDEKTLMEIVRRAIKEEFNLFKLEVATKEDLKAFATKEDLEALRAEMATKEDPKAFATKEDLKTFATRDDLNKLIGELMFEINYIKSEMVTRDISKSISPKRTSTLI